MLLVGLPQGLPHKQYWLWCPQVKSEPGEPVGSVPTCSRCGVGVGRGEGQWGLHDTTVCWRDLGVEKTRQHVLNHSEYWGPRTDLFFWVEIIVLHPPFSPEENCAQGSCNHHEGGIQECVWETVRGKNPWNEKHGCIHGGERGILGPCPLPPDSASQRGQGRLCPGTSLLAGAHEASLHWGWSCTVGNQEHSLSSKDSR